MAQDFVSAWCDKLDLGWFLVVEEVGMKRCIIYSDILRLYKIECFPPHCQIPSRWWNQLEADINEPYRRTGCPRQALSECVYRTACCADEGRKWPSRVWPCPLRAWSAQQAVRWIPIDHWWSLMMPRQCLWSLGGAAAKGTRPRHEAFGTDFWRTEEVFSHETIDIQ